MKIFREKFQWPILGHETICHFLQTSIINKRISHAYLFLGPEHLGKTLVAENFVGSLQCENLNGLSKKIPCHQCSACQQFFKKIHPDVYSVEKDKDKKNISIDQIRELEHKLSMCSFLTSYKIAIIHEAENMTIEAANSLLKTLEEPTPRTMIILIATKVNFIPSTILSRCLTLRFNLVSSKKIFDYLIKIKAEEKKALYLANLCQGRPGLAISMIKDPSLFDDYQDVINTLLEIIKNSIKDKFNIINRITPRGVGLAEASESLLSTLEIWTSIFRDLILIKSQNLDRMINLFIKKKLINLAHRYNLNQLDNLLNNLEKAKKLLLKNTNPKLLLENFVLKI